MNQLKSEAGDCHLTPGAIVDWLYDYAGQMREQTRPGLYLGTVHSAKGLEFRHVVLLDGDWDYRQDNASDERRLYYVGMTRAAETLTLGEFGSGHVFSRALSDDVMVRECAGTYMPTLECRYMQLTERDIDLSFSARHEKENPIHQAIANLKEGDFLSFRLNGERYELLDCNGCVVSRTKKGFKPEFQFDKCQVAAILVRFVSDINPNFLHQHKVEQWEVVIPWVMQTHSTPS